MGKAFFRHDGNARTDDKILELCYKFGNYKGYAVYFWILEVMLKCDDHMLLLNKCSAIAFNLHMQTEELQEFMDYGVEIGLFKIADEKYYSPRFLDEMSKVTDISKKRSESSLQRWSRVNKKTKDEKQDELPSIDENIPESVSKPERSPRKTQEPIDYQALLDYWNSKKIHLHKEFNSEWKKKSEPIIRKLGMDKVKTGIDNYSDTVHNNPWYKEHKSAVWGLYEFLTRDKGVRVFIDKPYIRNTKPGTYIEDGDPAF